MDNNVIKELEFLFNIINEDRFKGKLDMPEFHVVEGDMDWQWKVEYTDAKGFLVSVCEKKLMEDMRTIIVNMMHVMVHIYCKMEGIHDTCKDGWYHNRMFAATARSRGMVVEKGKTTYGFVTADIQDNIYERIMWQCEGKIDLKEQVLLIREKRKERVGDRKKRKYKCPVCGCIASALGSTSLICADCNRHMELI